MKKVSTFFVFLIFLQTANSQHGCTGVQAHLGYGTENNFGSTAFFGGAGVEWAKRKKWMLATQLTRFTTSLYNAYDGEDFDDEQQDYKAWFLTPIGGYRIIGNHGSFFSITLAAGPSLKYFHYKIFKAGLIKYYFDGRRIPIDSTISWYQRKGVNLSLYTGVSFDFRISQKLTAALFADAYSHRIWIEHFMPGVKVAYRMKN
jgi:hypothetical protein